MLSSLQTLGTPRLIALLTVAIGLMGLLGVFAIRGSHAPMALLYRDLDIHEAAQMAEDLDKAHIGHTVSPEGDSIFVPRDQVASARLLLAREGLPSGGGIGYEIFDHSNGLTATQFDQNINQTRALEGELERSIRLIQGVRAARVHLVLPHRELFSTERQGAQASVLLTLGGRALNAEAVQAILNLVSAAVPELKPQNIAIIDNRGNVLAKPGKFSDASEFAQSIEEQRRALESRLAQTVEEVLSPALGPAHVRAEASVTMNVDEVRETQESYDPDQQVLRSQQNTSDKSVNTESQPNASVANNLPNSNAGQAKVGSQDDRREETNNYEIGKKIRTVVQNQPRIQRISIAVIADGTMHTGTDGKSVWEPLDSETIDHITALTKSAIGYDEARGDKINVVSMKFTTEIPGEIASSGWLGMSLDKNDMMQLARSLMPGLLVFLALAFFAKPLLKKIIQPAPDVAASLVADEQINSLNRPITNLTEVSMEQGNTELSSQLALMSPESSSADYVNVSGIEGRLKASAIKRIRELADSSPEESLNVMRSWLSPHMDA